MIFEYDIGSDEEIANSDDLPDLQWMPCLRIFWAADWTAMQNVARKDFTRSTSYPLASNSLKVYTNPAIL